MVDEAKIWQILEKIKDPEIPVLTIEDLGVVRSVKLADNHCTIIITPTYSGCPAMQVIEDDIRSALKGIVECEIKYELSPAWTTDWISENGRKKLREYGIAPPEDEMDKNVLFSEPTVVPCPRCNSRNTKMISLFGSTACKAQYQCQDCQEPFDYFKCLR